MKKNTLIIPFNTRYNWVAIPQWSLSLETFEHRHCITHLRMDPTEKSGRARRGPQHEADTSAFLRNLTHDGCDDARLWPTRKFRNMCN